MKQELTRKEVENYINNNFAKSRHVPGKLIKIENGYYLTQHQAVVILSHYFSSNDYEFDKDRFTMWIVSSFKHLEGVDKAKSEKLQKHCIDWKFFEDNIQDGKTIKARDLYAGYKAKFSSITTHKKFYSDLQRWVVENGYHINLKNRLARRTITVVR